MRRDDRRGQGISVHRRLLALAVPIILANLTQPLLSAVDTAVAGHLPGAEALGGVALGGLVFNFLFWGFGFLRMGTTGLIAQAQGALDWAAVRATLYRALGLALVIGLLLLLARRPLVSLLLDLLGGSAEVRASAELYCAARIVSAPAALANYVVLGYLLGRQHARLGLALQLVINLGNMAAAILFVYAFGWGVGGLGAATACADWLGFAFGLILLLRLRPQGLPRPRAAELLERTALARLILVNRDIFLRTVALIASFGLFAHEGARMGDTILAANAVLLNFQTFMAYGLDGFAHAAEALVGMAIGARDRASLAAAIRASMLWAGVGAALFSLAYFGFGPSIIRLLTDIPDIRAAALAYLPWAAISPLVSVWGFQLDGIYIGAIRTRELRNSVFLALLAFLVAVRLFEPLWGNHGLWAALLLMMGMRGATLGLWLRRLPEKACSGPP
ncbi:MAG TPA: MATE family efflux transporter [Aliidongia sp.]|nr:MATE family efflux transporter [Aliidongia sp.]